MINRTTEEPKQEMKQPHRTKPRRSNKQQNFYKKANASLKEKSNTVAIGTVAKRFTKEQASEALPIGPFAGVNPGREPPVVGTNEDLGVNAPASSD